MIIRKMEREHTHVCADCGAAWTHGPEARGDLDKHKCPDCGKVEWWGRRTVIVCHVGFWEWLGYHLGRIAGVFRNV